MPPRYPPPSGIPMALPSSHSCLPPPAVLLPWGAPWALWQTSLLLKCRRGRGNIPRWTIIANPSPAEIQWCWSKISGRPPPQSEAPAGGRLPLRRGVGSERLLRRRYTQPTRGCRSCPLLLSLERCPGPCWPGTPPLSPIPNHRYACYGCYRCRT